MNLAGSIHKGIISIKPGGVHNTHILKRRRNTIFFEDLISEYYKICEQHGHGEQLYSTAQEWMAKVGITLSPPEVLKNPGINIINNIQNPMWSNLGLINKIHAEQDKDRVSVTVESPCCTRIIGKNAFMSGVFTGAMNYAFLRQVELLSEKTTKERSIFEYKILSTKFVNNAIDRQKYIKMNEIPDTKSTSMKHALNAKTIQLHENNRLYLRNHPLWYVENTIFHMLGHRGLMLAELEDLSKNFFKSLIDKDTSLENKLRLLKTIIQTLGWGIVTILIDGNQIIIKIDFIPHGLQTTPDNYSLLTSVWTGYLKAINENSELQNSTVTSNTHYLKYSIH